MNVYLALLLFSFIILLYWVITELFTLFFRLAGLPAELLQGRMQDMVFIVREAITNAIKHGKAKRIVLLAEPDDGGASLRILNDGEPFDVAAALDSCFIAFNIDALDIYCNYIFIIRLCIEIIAFRKISDTVIDILEYICPGASRSKSFPRCSAES